MSTRFSGFRGGPLVSLLSLVSVTTLWSQRAYVVNPGSNNVSVIDTATNTVLTTIAIPAGLTPSEIAITPDGNRAYVTTGQGPLVAINLATNTVLTTIATEHSSNPAILPDGSRVYVISGPDTVSVISAASNTVLTTITLGRGNIPSDWTLGTTRTLGITPDGSRVYVGRDFHTIIPGQLFCCSTGLLNVIDTATDSLSTSFPARCCPNQIAFTPDSSRAIVTLNVGREFTPTLATVIDTAANTFVANIIGGVQSINLSGRQVAITPDGSRTYIVGSGDGPAGGLRALFTIDTADPNTAPVTIPVAAGFIAITPDGSRVYATNPGSNSVSVISTATNTVLTTIPVGLNPSHIAITPDGTRAYVTNALSDTVSAINTATNTAVTTIVVGDAPRQIAIAPAAAAPAVPKNDSVTPSSGAGMSGVFTFRYSHPNGNSHLNQLFGSLNETAFGQQGCNVFYRADMKSLFLKNDTDDGWLGPLTGVPSGTGVRFSRSLSNSRCTLEGNASSVSRSGNTLALTAALAFKPAFAGVKGIFMYAIDSAGLTTPTREQLGTWTVAAAGPSNDSVTPSSGSGPGSFFAFRYSSPSGHTQLRQVFGSLNDAAFGVQGCNAMYLRDNNGLYLNNDSDDGWLGPLTGAPSGTLVRFSGSLSNSRCTLDGNKSSVSGSGNTLTFVVSLAFKPAFAGLKGIYLYAIDSTDLTTPTREQRGTWMVTAGP